MIEGYYFKIIPADINFICPIVEEVTDYVRHIGSYVSEDVVFNIKVILNELLINAIIHGSFKDEAKQVFVKCIPNPMENLILRVTDEGRGFNYSNIIDKEISDCSLVENNYKESGRGMLIIKSLCQKISFNENGNEIEVEIKFN